MSSRAESSSPRGDSAAHNLPRIALRTLPVDEALALLAGAGEATDGLRWHPEYPMAESLDALSLLIQAHAAVGWSAAQQPQWWLQQIVLDEHVVVGDIGFHGPPAVGGPVAVEIGYNVVEALRGRGVATVGCAMVLGLAWAAGADVVVAETMAVNIASQRVLLRNGFVDLGDHRYRIDRPAP